MRVCITAFLYSLYICILSASAAWAGVDEVKVVDPLTPIYTAEDVKKATAQDTLVLSGPRNGVCSAQAVIIGSGLNSVKASISALKNAGREIPASAIKVRYAAKEEGFQIGKLDMREGHTTHNFLEAYYDILFPAPPKDTGVMPVWITVEIPASAAAGDYTGILKIASESLPVKLTVTPWVCPSPGDMETHVGIVTSTETLALYYKKEMWSEDHWKLIEKQLELLGPTGSDDLWVHALWNLGYKKGGTPLLRFKQQGGSIIPDFTLIDRYFELYKKYCPSPEFIIVTAWDGNPQGKKGKPGQPETYVSVDGKAAVVPRVYAPGGKEIWEPALKGIKERAGKMGWNSDNILIGLASDQRPSKEEVAGFKDLGFSKWAIWTHGRGEKSYQEVQPGEQYLYTNGMELSYYVHPYTPDDNNWSKSGGKTRMVKIENGIQGGWNLNVNAYSSTRNDLHKYAALTQWRGYANGTTLGGYRMGHESGGFAFLWFDWFSLTGSSTQPFICRVCDVMSRNNSPALVAPGPDGPVGTVRYEMLREGIQECEARIFIEKALVQKKAAGKLDTDSRSVLNELIKYRFLDGKFNGGHAGGNLGVPQRMWGFAPYPDWMSLSGRLFTQAYEVARETGAKEFINAAPAAGKNDSPVAGETALIQTGGFIEMVQAKLRDDLAKGIKVVVAYRMGSSIKPAQILKTMGSGVLISVNGKEKTIPWPALTEEMEMSLKKRYRL